MPPPSFPSIFNLMARPPPILQRFKRQNCLLLYPESFNIEKLSDWCRQYDCKLWYILHNRDLEDDGITLKKEHWHVVLTFPPDPKGNYPCCKRLSIPSNLWEECKDLCKALRYLVHLDHPKKHQYDKRFIVGDLDEWEKEIVNFSRAEKVLHLVENGASFKEIIHQETSFVWNPGALCKLIDILGNNLSVPMAEYQRILDRSNQLSDDLRIYKKCYEILSLQISYLNPAFDSTKFFDDVKEGKYLF